MKKLLRKVHTVLYSVLNVVRIAFVFLLTWTKIEINFEISFGHSDRRALEVFSLNFENSSASKTLCNTHFWHVLQSSRHSYVKIHIDA